METANENSVFHGQILTVFSRDKIRERLLRFCCSLSVSKRFCVLHLFPVLVGRKGVFLFWFDWRGAEGKRDRCMVGGGNAIKFNLPISDPLNNRGVSQYII